VVHVGDPLSYRGAQIPPGGDVVLRLGRWQREPGVRAAFTSKAEEGIKNTHPFR